MPIITEGAEEAKRLSDEDKAQRSGSFFRPEDFVIKQGDQKTYFLRFVTEKSGIITAEVHRFMDTKPEPEGINWKWPKMMWAVCARAGWFRLPDTEGNPTDEYEEGYGDCYLHNTYAGVIEGQFKKDKGRADKFTYGLAVVQEPIMREGSIVGFKDTTAEYKDKDGKTHSIPKLVLVTQRYSNFWNSVAAAAILPPYSIRDKVFSVTRVENDYTVVSIAQDPPPADGRDPYCKKYQDALELTGFSLRDYLLEHSTPDHYARFFDPSKTPEGGYNRKKEDGEEEADATAGAGEETPADGPVIDPAAMAGFNAILAKRGDKAAK